MGSIPLVEMSSFTILVLPDRLNVQSSINELEVKERTSLIAVFVLPQYLQPNLTLPA